MTKTYSNMMKTIIVFLATTSTTRAIPVVLAANNFNGLPVDNMMQNSSNQNGSIERSIITSFWYLCFITMSISTPIASYLIHNGAESDTVFKTLKGTKHCGIFLAISLLSTIGFIICAGAGSYYK